MVAILARIEPVCGQNQVDICTVYADRCVQQLTRCVSWSSVYFERLCALHRITRVPGSS